MSKVWTTVAANEFEQGEQGRAENENGSIVIGEFDGDEYVEGYGELGGLSTYVLDRAGFTFEALREQKPLPTTPGSVIKAVVYDDPEFLLLDANGDWGSYTKAINRIESLSEFIIIFEAPEGL